MKKLEIDTSKITDLKTAIQIIEQLLVIIEEQQERIEEQQERIKELEEKVAELYSTRLRFPVFILFYISR